MPRTCAAFGCTNNDLKEICKEKNISFHRFPLNKPECKQWLMKLKKKNFVPSEYSHLCSEHFTEDCFTYQPFTNRRGLKPGAIPTLFGCVKTSDETGTLDEMGTSDELGFPKDPVRRKQWILALRRKNFEPSKTSVICGKHFQTGRPLKDPDHPDYVPNIFVFKTSKKTDQSKSGIEPSKERTDEPVNIVCTPEVILNSEPLSVSSPKTEELCQIKEEISVEEEQNHSEDSDLVHEKDELPMDLESEYVAKKEAELSSLKLEMQEVYSTLHNVTEERDQLANALSETNVAQSILQNSILKKEEEISRLKTELQQAYTEVNALRREKEELQKKVSTIDQTQCILQDPVKLRYYTGLNSLKDFQLVFSLFSNVETNFKNISLETQVLIVLMRLKLNLWTTDLAYRFNSSQSTVHRICDSMIPFLERKLDTLVKNPINNALKKNIPAGFKNTVYESLYQRLHRNAKFATKQSKNDSMDSDEV